MIYQKNYPMFRPKDSGLPFGSFTDEEIRKLTSELTEEEKQLPHAKYFSKEPIQLPQEYLDVLAAGPMEAANAFLPEDFGRYMNTSGHCKVENGYCVLPNGVTYAAVLLKQEGRTDEMVRHYNERFAPERTLFYKTWCPGSHYLHYSDGCVEDFGFGRMNMKFVTQLQPEHLGINPAEVEKNDPFCISIGGTTALGYNLDSDHPEIPEWNTITFYHRVTDYGREMRVRLWYGIGFENGQVRYTIPPKEKAMEIAKKTMHHVMLEYTNDHYLETKFWEDSQGKD